MCKFDPAIIAPIIFRCMVINICLCRRFSFLAHQPIDMNLKPFLKLLTDCCICYCGIRNFPDTATNAVYRSRCFFIIDGCFLSCSLGCTTEWYAIIHHIFTNSCAVIYRLIDINFHVGCTFDCRILCHPDIRIRIADFNSLNGGICTHNTVRL